MPNVPEFLDFASLWSFVPKHRWRDDASIVQSQKQKLKNALLYRDAIKHYTTFSGDNVPSVYDQAAKECVSESKLNDFFDKDMLLVPVPRSKLNKPDTLWPSKLIAESLIRVGIGSGMVTCLSRTVAVHTSHQGDVSKRLTASEHCKTMTVERMIVEPTKILLVDDLITRGSTFLGAACRISEMYPKIEIKAFAPVRTISRLNEFTSKEDPHTGLISLCTDGHGTTIRIAQQ